MEETEHNVSPVLICCFCFSEIEPDDAITFIKGESFDDDGGSEYLEFQGHEYCADRRHSIIMDFTEVLENNRQDMPGPNKEDPRTLHARPKTTKELENPEDKPETPDSEVNRYFSSKETS